MREQSDAFSYHAERRAIGLAPLIDVVFLLLIFFMVATVFVEERVMQLSAEEKNGTSGDKTVMTIVLNQQGRLFYQEQAYDYQGIVSLVKSRLAQEHDIGVIVESDPMTKVQDTITVVDYLEQAGARHVRFVLSRPFVFGGGN